MIFPFFKKIGFWAILGPPYHGIGATIRIDREMLCLPYAGFLNLYFFKSCIDTLQGSQPSAMTKTTVLEKI